MKCKLNLEKLENRILLNGTFEFVPGYMEFRNFLDGIPNTNNALAIVQDNEYCPGALDSLDTYDIEQTSFANNVPGVVSNINGILARYDVRDESTISPIELNSFYTGNVSQNTSNYLEVKFIQFPGEPLYTFGTKPITLQEDNGQRNDVKQAITEGAGTGLISLDDVPAETSGTYATPEVHFKETADLNNDGRVDMVDFALLGRNWMNYEGMPGATGDYLLGDITGGSNGEPDGNVNIADLTELGAQWLNVQPTAE